MIILGSNSITEVGAQALATALRTTTQLEELNLCIVWCAMLDYNDLRDAGTKELAEALAVNRSLRSLILGIVPCAMNRHQ